MKVYIFNLFLLIIAMIAVGFLGFYSMDVNASSKSSISYMGVDSKNR